MYIIYWNQFAFCPCQTINFLYVFLCLGRIDSRLGHRMKNNEHTYRLRGNGTWHVVGHASLRHQAQGRRNDARRHPHGHSALRHCRHQTGKIRCLEQWCHPGKQVNIRIQLRMAVAWNGICSFLFFPYLHLCPVLRLSIIHLTNNDHYMFLLYYFFFSVLFASILQMHHQPTNMEHKHTEWSRQANRVTSTLRKKRSISWRINMSRSRAKNSKVFAQKKKTCILYQNFSIAAASLTTAACTL